MKAHTPFQAVRQDWSLVLVGGLAVLTSCTADIPVDNSQQLQPDVVLEAHAGLNALAFDPSGTLLASASDDKTVRLWDVPNGKESKTLTGHNERVQSVAFAPQGKVLASGASDGQVFIWNVESGRKDADFQLSMPGATLVYIRSLAYSPDGDYLSAGFNGDNYDSKTRFKLVVREMATKKMLIDLLGRHTNVTHMTFTPDSKKLIFTDAAAVRLLEIPSCKELPSVERPNPSGVASLAISADGKYLALGEWAVSKDVKLPRRVTLWDLAAAKVHRVLNANASNLIGVSFLADGKYVAAVDAEGMVWIWQRNSGKEVASFRGYYAPGRKEPRLVTAISPTTNRVAIGGGRSGTIHVWDVSKYLNGE